MQNKEETIKALNAIRKAIDVDVVDVDIESVKNKLLGLTQLMGLSAEANASARKILSMKELSVLQKIDKTLSPSIQKEFLSAECFEEEALWEYSDRLNAAITHTIDGLRTVISLYKIEMENSLKQ